MVAVPIGYEAFQGKRRKAVTVLCFMISSAMIASVMIFVDSFSLEVWNDNNDVGPVSLVIIGDGIETELGNIRDIDGINEAALIRGHYTYLSSHSLGLLWQANTFGIMYDEELGQDFPTIFTIIEGRFPENASEIVLSELFANLLYVDIGDNVNYSLSSINPFHPSVRPSIVSGIFVHGEKNHSNPYYYTRGNVLFHSSLSSAFTPSYIYGNVDRTRIAPYDPAGSLNYLNTIDEEIRRLQIERGGGSRYSVINLLSDGIADYMEYLSDLRLSQLLRSGGAILLELAVIYLAINHIWHEREYEINMLYSRGASRFRIGLSVNLEIMTMAVLSLLPGFVSGFVASRFAIASDGFFVVNFQRLFSEPLLITYDSLSFSVFAGVVFPLIVLILHQLRSHVKINVKERTGRLARITKSLSFMKADSILLVMSLAFLLALNMEGTVVSRNPLLFSILSFLPFTLFFGMASLAIKGLRRGANLFSKGLGIVVGRIPAAIGIRRISKATASSGPLIIVLVLAMSLGWSYAINDATLPYTRMNQSRFAIGGDLAFHLDTDEASEWDSFTGNLTHDISDSIGSRLNLLSLSLSEGLGGLYQFVALDPIEYAKVGYDSVGSPLNESGLGVLMDQLAISQSGAIITQDIAEAYGLSTGGLLRAFWQNATELEAIELSIIGVVDALPDTLTFTSGYNPYPGLEWTYEVGKGKVWVHKETIDHIVSQDTNVQNVFCMRVKDSSNATLIAEALLANGWMDVLEQDEWASAFNEVQTYKMQDIYVLDRSTDTLLTILSVGAIFGAFTVYAIEGAKSRRREIALLRSLGAERNLVVKTQASEMIVLFLISIILLVLFTPILTVNFLLAAVRTYGGVVYVYPTAVTILSPWLLMATILSFFVLCVVIFIGVIAVFSSQVNMSEALNSSWTAASPQYLEES